MGAIYKNGVLYAGSGGDQVQTNWNETNPTSAAYLLNKPTALSAFSNDSGFITNTVNDLTNYYTTSNTYTKTEVDNLISTIPTFDIEVVESLLVVTDPNTHTVYLVPQGSETGNLYTEYIYLIDETTHEGTFEKIGTQTVNLSYTNAYLPGVTNVQGALDALVDIDKKDFWLSGTKAANVSSVTFTDNRITTNSIYEVFTSDSNLMFTGSTLSTGSIVINLDPSYIHSSAIGLSVHVHNP